MKVVLMFNQTHCRLSQVKDKLRNLR